MPKASPHLRSFNAGVFSPLMAGRTDIERYPASLRDMLNFVAAPQGPAIRRSGTYFMQAAYTHDKRSALVEFEFSKDQALVIEFSEYRMRLIDEYGLQTYTPVAPTAISQGNPFKFTSATLGASVGEQVVLSGFPDEYSLNGVVGKITAKVGSDYTLDIGYTLGAPPLADVRVARVYEIVTPYTEANLQELRYVQSVDVVYLMDGSSFRKLSRYGAYDWRLTTVDIFDGPYMDENDAGVRLTPGSTGNAASNATGVASASGFSGAGKEADKAFDDDKTTYWESNADQSGELIFTPTTPFACNGYVVQIPRDNASTSYAAKDYAPGTWTFEGWDGAAWVVLDSQFGYVLYDNYRSAYIKINNATVFSKYKLNISQCTRNGTVKPRVARLILSDAAALEITFTASAVTGINGDQGFLATDVGRLIRVYGTDGMWRPAKITERTSTTVVKAKLQSEPLANTDALLKWRLGYWSDTTGWPTCGLLFDDCLWLGGSRDAPDVVVKSMTGAYEKFSPTDPTGEVLEESGVAVRLNARQLGSIMWMENDEKVLLVGTLNGEWVIGPQKEGAISARNIKARQATRRGSADMDAVKVDAQVLYVQRARRTVREFTYAFEKDRYTAPSMSQFASHLGVPRFAEMDYAAEPYSIVWVRRDDGTLAGLTYNREEGVIGWHLHDVGGVIESMCVIPAKDQMQDVLWLAVRRTVNGQTRRYIERLMPFWDFEFTMDDAFYVDCGLRYDGDPIVTVYGLSHVEGEDVVGLVDGVPFGPLPVEAGAVTLPHEGSHIVVGLPFESVAETARIEAGAGDGTAQGKTKRTNHVGVDVWMSAGGEVGVRNEDTGEVEYAPLEYNEAPYDEIEAAVLHTEIVAITPPPGYGKLGTLHFRQPGEQPLPLNIVAFMPQLHTQDR